MPDTPLTEGLRPSQIVPCSTCEAIALEGKKNEYILN